MFFNKSYNHVEYMKSLKHAIKIPKSSIRRILNGWAFHHKSLKTFVKSTFSCFSRKRQRRVPVVLLSSWPPCRLRGGTVDGLPRLLDVIFSQEIIKTHCKINIFRFFDQTKKYVKYTKSLKTYHKSSKTKHAEGFASVTCCKMNICIFFDIIR